MTTIEQEHKEIYQTISETIVAEPETHTVTEIDPRVLRGVLYLDEHYPGWAKKINLETFRLTDCRYCVVGQVFGSYSKTQSVFNLRNDPFTNLGAMEACTYGVTTRGNDWTLLEKDWRIMIKERQEG